MIVSWICPNSLGAPRASRHRCVNERTDRGWVIRCSCGYRALASSGEVIEAERVSNA